MSAKSYSKKVIVSGDLIEVYEYANPVLEGYDIKEYHECGRSYEATEVDKEINRDKVFNRAKRNVKRLINSNIEEYSKFITLTFKEHVTEVKAANYEFKKFRQRLERHIGFKLKYLAVIEFTKIGRIHYHVVIFNLPYLKNSVLSDIWGQGYIKINKIDGCDNVGAYVSKYMTKTVDDRLKGEKMYFRSRNLSEPIEIKENDRVENLVGALPVTSVTYETTFTNEYNTISYKQYNTKMLDNKYKNTGKYKKKYNKRYTNKIVQVINI